MSAANYQLIIKTKPRSSQGSKSLDLKKKKKKKKEVTDLTECKDQDLDLYLAKIDDKIVEIL